VVELDVCMYGIESNGIIAAVLVRHVACHIVVLKLGIANHFISLVQFPLLALLIYVKNWRLVDSLYANRGKCERLSHRTCSPQQPMHEHYLQCVGMQFY
jgi:hypothetical protein